MSKPNSQPVTRRTVFAGAGAVGILGAVAMATRVPGVAPSPLQSADAKPAESGGYRLTDHVKQYYATARV